ncbi:calcium-dependent kinase (macronuclear) [Tetrahymena thermophila SB210]|uniref:non-specific serine/threonine protein kinase n=1 Tax=Tetrahymena thermophila (strain SB210) TaxID=312017 RepID=A4VDW8_TETTS|nr:calcium-dependent kinase [Tetrahymena thermophila SB210]EDK31725.2 calcium-dependent kinase [Tetrahymena thermophila SB210]|eukprot:XP_001470789.2 calcium-dependent kinase [Tetrahymena thermophila SB210]
MSDKSITVEPSVFVQRKLGSFDKLCEEYDILNKKLGEGFFGSVEVVQLKGTKQNRAMKKVDKHMLDSKMQREEFIQEIDILKTLDHPNILKIYEFYEDNRYLYIITELCNGRELFDVIVEDDTCFTEQQTMKIMQQSLSALQYAHSKCYAHRDIKPENIMIDIETQKIKIIDWGTSKKIMNTQLKKQKYNYNINLIYLTFFDQLSEAILINEFFFLFIYENPNLNSSYQIKGTSFNGEKIKQLVGSAYYIAPEILKRKGYDEKVDIWSLGIVFYLLITGTTPYNAETTTEIFEEIKKYKLSFEDPLWEKFSTECKDLLSKMLNPQPNKRISAQQALKHPWFETQPNQVPQNLLKTKLNSMKTFTYQSKLQMATIQYVASHLLSQQEKEELSDLFIHLDTNKDGKLSKEEIFNGYKNLYGEVEARQISEKIFSEVDVDNNGSIDYNEFLACTMQKKKLLSQGTLKRAFDLFDIDGDKQITAKEIKSVLQDNANSFDTEIWEQIIQEVDKDGNGVIDFNEFQQMMDSIVQKQTQNNKKQSSLTPFQIITRSRSKLDVIQEEDDSSSEQNEVKQESKATLKEPPTLQSAKKSSSKKEIRNEQNSKQLDEYEVSPRKQLKKK